MGSADLSLSKDLENQLKERPKIEIVDGAFQLPIGLPIEEKHDKYKGELYALIVGLTTGGRSVW